MPTALRILLVEDSPEDAELIVCHLQSHGIHFTYAREDTR